MVCEFEYCIHNKDYACILMGVQVNALGMCDSCIMVSFGKELMEKTSRSSSTIWSGAIQS